ncbi:MAG: metallopeptidase family protein [Sphingomonadales bacterium]|nr:metallopeptidase family protein [Sphingomonadales bacterium]
MARRTIAAMPPEFRAELGAVVVRVDDYAARDVLDGFGMTDPMQLSGLYSGRPVGIKSVSDSGAMPDMIHLYRQPILAEAQQRGIAVETLVAHVLVHEVGHHFGFSDDDMHWLEDQAD